MDLSGLERGRTIAPQKTTPGERPSVRASTVRVLRFWQSDIDDSINLLVLDFIISLNFSILVYDVRIVIETQKIRIRIYSFIVNECFIRMTILAFN